MLFKSLLEVSAFPFCDVLPANRGGFTTYAFFVAVEDLLSLNNAS